MRPNLTVLALLVLLVTTITSSPSLGQEPGIRIEGATLADDVVWVGTIMTVQGFVLYNDTSEPVTGAEVTVMGAFIATTEGPTDQDGRFNIIVQAPLTVLNDLSLEIHARDPQTNRTDSLALNYDVVPQPPPPNGSRPVPWWIVLTIAGVTISVSLLVGIYFVGRRNGQC